MKKIISFALLALAAVVLPLSLVGCGKKNVSLEGTWTYSRIEFLYYDMMDEDKNVFTNDKNIKIDNLFGRYKNTTITFSSDGNGELTDEGDVTEFKWEEVTLDEESLEREFGKSTAPKGKIIEAVYGDDNKKETYTFLFDGSNLFLLESFKYETNGVKDVHCKIIFKK